MTPISLNDAEREFIAYRLHQRAKHKLKELLKASKKANINPKLLQYMRDDIAECERIAGIVGLPPL